MVNKGNCLYAQGQYQSSVEYYQEALSVEATCSEALYNLGLAYKKLKEFSSALSCFTKLHTIFKSLPQVLYQIADMYPHCINLNDYTIYMYCSVCPVREETRVQRCTFVAIQLDLVVWHVFIFLTCIA